MSTMNQYGFLPCPQCHRTSVELDVRSVPEWETEYQNASGRSEIFRAGWHTDVSVKCRYCGWTPTNFGYKPWGDDLNKLAEWWNAEVRKQPLY